MFDWLKKKDTTPKLMTAEEAHVMTLTQKVLLDGKLLKTSLQIMDFHKENILLIAKQIENTAKANGGWYETHIPFHALKLPSRNLWTEEYDALIGQIERDLISKGYKVTVKERTNNNIYKGSIDISWREIMPPDGNRGLLIKTANIARS